MKFLLYVFYFPVTFGQGVYHCIFKTRKEGVGRERSRSLVLSIKSCHFGRCAYTLAWDVGVPGCFSHRSVWEGTGV